MKAKKADRQKWVIRAMKLASLWQLGFHVHPWADFVKTGMWTAEFDNLNMIRRFLPRTGARSGKNVEAAAEKLVRDYIEAYGEKMHPTRIRTVEELDAVWEFMFP